MGPLPESLNRTKYNKAPNMALGTAPYLTTTAGAILDQKGVLGDAAFAYYPVGTILDEFDQSLGLRLPTGCGGTQDITAGGVFHFQMIKVDSGHWKLVSP